MEAPVAGNPLHACSTARLQICYNNTFRCCCEECRHVVHFHMLNVWSASI